jgi:LysR family cys regulon transcriptional activator
MIRRIGEEYSESAQGTLTVATTHTQACYALPTVITAFLAKYPKVQLRIRQGTPQQIADMVASDEADVAIATESVSGGNDSLVALPCYRWNRCIMVLPEHPLATVDAPLTLQDLARYPIITYDFSMAGQSMVNRTFTDAKLTPNFIITALDSDVIKTYVKAGLGVGLLAKMAYNQEQDRSLRVIDVAHLFEPNTTWIGIKRGSYLREYVFDFIEGFAPHLKRSIVNAAIHVE